MNGKKRTVPFALMGVLIAAGIIGGVTVLQQQGIFGWNTTSILGQQGTLAAQITDPPNVPAGVTGVYIAYTDIQVHLSDASHQSGWYTVANSGQLDLMSVLSVRETLGSAQVQSGNFNLVRFDIANATVTYNGVNYTAYVPANKITVPIADGGVQVLSGSSTGFVIDLSPTVVPYQNGTSLGFVLVPSATSLPIPPLNWHASDDQEGAKEDLSGDSWWHHSEDSLKGNLTISSVSLNATNLSITLENVGSNNITLNAVSILGNATASAVLSQEPITTVSTTETTTTETHSSTTSTETQTSTTTSDSEHELITIASFQVLSNGTLVQPHDGLEIEDNMVGLVIQSGQSVTLTFNGQISTIHDELSLYPISPGHVFQIAALGEFGTSAYVNATATA